MIQELGLDIIFWWENVDWEGGPSLRFLPESAVVEADVVWHRDNHVLFREHSDDVCDVVM